MAECKEAKNEIFSLFLTANIGSVLRKLKELSHVETPSSKHRSSGDQLIAIGPAVGTSGEQLLSPESHTFLLQCPLLWKYGIAMTWTLSKWIDNHKIQVGLGPPEKGLLFIVALCPVAGILIKGPTAITSISPNRAYR